MARAQRGFLRPGIHSGTIGNRHVVLKGVELLRYDGMTCVALATMLLWPICGDQKHHRDEVRCVVQNE